MENEPTTLNNRLADFTDRLLDGDIGKPLVLDIDDPDLFALEQVIIRLYRACASPPQRSTLAWRLLTGQKSRQSPGSNA